MLGHVEVVAEPLTVPCEHADEHPDTTSSGIDASAGMPPYWRARLNMQQMARAL